MSAGSVGAGTLKSEGSSPSKMVRAQDIEELNKATATGNMFNFESIRKQKLEKKLGIADDNSSSVIQGNTGEVSPTRERNLSKQLQLMSTMSEARMQRQISALKRKEI